LQAYANTTTTVGIIVWLRDARSTVRNAVVLLLGLALAASALCAQRNSQGMPEASPAIRNAISVASTKYKLPGIAAALFKQGRLIAIEVCGVRDTKSNAPVTANTVFGAGLTDGLVTNHPHWIPR